MGQLHQKVGTVGIGDFPEGGEVDLRTLPNSSTPRETGS